MNPTEALHNWLTEVIPHEPRWIDTAERTAPRKTRLAYLFFCNGASFTVRGWGFLGTNSNGHPAGLEEGEGIELLGCSGVLRGFELCGVNVMDELTPILNEYHDAWMERRAKLETGTLDK